MEVTLPTKRTVGVEDAVDVPVASAPLIEPDPRLKELMGKYYSAEEAKTWASMPETRRVKAIQRMKALNRYCVDEDEIPAKDDDESKISAKDAARDAGVKLGRFYQMARLWSSRRSLGSLGAYSSATKPRRGLKSEVTNALQAVVKEVVEATANRGDSISALARKLAIASNLAPDDVPAPNTLRMFIEREQRRVRQTRLAGARLLFDLSVSSLRRIDGRPHIVFLVIDAGTSLILGHAQGLTEDSAAGYESAARDALRRIPCIMPPAGIWSESMEQPQIVPGTDASAIAAMIEPIKRELDGLAPQVGGENSQGGHIRRHTGLKLGSVRLMPGRALAKGTSDPNDGIELSSADAYARIELAVAEHNAAILTRLVLDGSDEPPGEMIRMLELMAST